MARHFDGTGDLINFQAWDDAAFLVNTAYTFAALVYVEPDTGDGCIIRCYTITGGSAQGGLQLHRRGSAQSSVLGMFSSFSASTFADSTITLTDGKWWLVAATTPQGTNVTVRLHALDVAAGTWTHEDQQGTPTHDSLGAGVEGATLGAFSSTVWTGDIAWIGIWEAALTDAQVEALVTEAGLWAVQPVRLWYLDQDAISQLVREERTGVVQTSIVDTTVSTRSVPLFSRDAQPLEVA